MKERRCCSDFIQISKSRFKFHTVRDNLYGKNSKERPAEKLGRISKRDRKPKVSRRAWNRVKTGRHRNGPRGTLRSHKIHSIMRPARGTSPAKSSPHSSITSRGYRMGRSAPWTRGIVDIPAGGILAWRYQRTLQTELRNIDRTAKLRRRTTGGRD